MVQRTSRGSVYLPVLGAAMIVTVIGMAAIWTSRLQTRRTVLQRQKAQAEACAMAAIESGLYWIDVYPSWRSGGMTWPGGFPFADGTFSLTVTDPTDGNLADAEDDPVILTGVGEVGEARHSVKVTLLAEYLPLEALKTCIHCDGELKVNAGKTATILNAPASTNGLLRIDGRLDGDAEAQSVTGGGTVTGSLTVPGSLKALPASSVIQTYRDLAVTIPRTGSTMERVVLGPQSNPWGLASPDGVYYMDTAGNDLTIRGIRLSGTLIIRASGKKVTLSEAVLMEPARADFPVLIVDGELHIQLQSGQYSLSESSYYANFNPPACPYSGQSDYDLFDSYPNELRGLVYATGKIEFKNYPRVFGTVLGGANVVFDDYAQITYDSSIADSPPMGFRSVQMRLAGDSWQQVVEP